MNQITRREAIKIASVHVGLTLGISGAAMGAAVISAARVRQIGREELAKKREAFQPGGGAKPGPRFTEAK